MGVLVLRGLRWNVDHVYADKSLQDSERCVRFKSPEHEEKKSTNNVHKLHMRSADKATESRIHQPKTRAEDFLQLFKETKADDAGSFTELDSVNFNVWGH